jgi:hypothetical protein
MTYLKIICVLGLLLLGLVVPANATNPTPIPIATVDFNNFNNATGAGNTDNFSLDGIQSALFGPVDRWIGSPMRNMLIFVTVGAVLAISTGSLFPAGIILVSMGGLFLYQMPADWRFASVMMMVLGGALIIFQMRNGR